ncbi:transport protein particle 22 kDa subunit, putative [Entamoeba invadens IP1]|uniref:Trafficking protein particle complex subunit n=1 Tax=Entamoeba invadens IP1 TaxID=370355 RepID=A0A0A1U3C8_ENTIV|nr:transport protein particle 22 kDa subunit, putative [Entamoeba invadens IP1]ELP87258.1 transport protein particle 22 kDa subunit, putative [Entamoeba invadens IP1]|eukprot:XP_004254029.1 transport protein particle 22 kDa subunit, putative [Entamoeba invadens IP1]
MISKSEKQKAGDVVWGEMKKINSELLTMTYGGIVVQLLRENDFDADKVNAELEDMGYNIGIRLVEEYLAKVEGKMSTKCISFKEHIESITFVAFKMFLGMNCECFEVHEKQWRISLPNNVLSEYVQLPDKLKQKLWYSNIYCGIIRGALEMLKYKVECRFVNDVLQGNKTSTEIEVNLVDILDQAKYVNYNS